MVTLCLPDRAFGECIYLSGIVLRGALPKGHTVEMSNPGLLLREKSGMDGETEEINEETGKRFLNRLLQKKRQMEKLKSSKKRCENEYWTTSCRGSEDWRNGRDQ